MKVRCVDVRNRDDDALKVGKTYLVLGESPSVSRIRPRVDWEFSHFAKWRFEVVESEPYPKKIRHDGS